MKIEWRGEWTLAPMTSSPLDSQMAAGWQRRWSFFELLTKGPVPQQMVKLKTIQSGLSYRTVERERDPRGRLGETGMGPGSACHWRLPPDST